MSQQISLQEAERKAFTAAHNDGLWDFMLGCFFLGFAGAPYLSESLGDFWSSVVFLPFWGVVYLAVRLIRKQVVIPRIGVVTFGHARKRKLAKLSVVMLIVNVIAFAVGIAAALSRGQVPGQVYTIFIGMALLLGFSVAAFYLDFTRLYGYGLMVGLAPLVGEWLWTQGYATHHGFPVTFGTAAGVMILVGLVVFGRLLRDNPVPAMTFPAEDAADE